MADNMWNRENGEGEMVVVKVDNGRDGAKCAIGDSPLLFTSQTSSKLKFPSTTTICVTVTYYCKNLWRIASPRPDLLVEHLLPWFQCDCVIYIV